MNKIDLSYLQEITGGDNEIMAEMIDLFLDQTPDHVANLKQQSADGEWLTLAAEAHKLKPTLLYVGLTGLHNTAQEIEMSGRKKQNLDKVPELIENIEEGFFEVKDDLEKTKAELLSR